MPKNLLTHAIFVELRNATFVASVKLRRFHCDFCAIRVGCLCNFPKIASKLRQVSNMMETVTTAISQRHSHRNRTENAASLHLSATKIAQKNRMCKRAPSLSKLKITSPDQKRQKATFSLYVPDKCVRRISSL